MGALETVTFGVIAYNEHNYLPDLLSDLLSQTYPKKLIEVILVDGNSNDDTLDIMRSFQESHNDLYKDIKIYQNPKKIQPSGWNIVLQNMHCDVVLRIDAHARLPKDFVERNMFRINAGENVCGGPRENIIDEDTAWKQMLLDAEQSMFGSGIASYRKQTSDIKYVKSVFHGAYRKDVIENVGRFNENLVRTEDNEYHYRIIKAGYKICYDPCIKSLYQTRSSLKSMIRQKYLNGKWIGITLFVCPHCISLFHLIPAAFVLAMTFCSIIAAIGCKFFLVALLSLYILFLIASTLISCCKSKNYMDVFLPAVIFSIHIAYGLGTIIGLFKRIERKD